MNPHLKALSQLTRITLLTATLLLFGSPGAFAQSDSEELILEEVIVTATKRAVSLQDIPMSVSALQGSDLEDQMAFNFADYAESVPGLSFNGGEPGNDKLIVRGISTDSFNGQLQSTVGVYIDDMPGVDVFIPTSTPDLHMFDVNRVEVLRGPQGTLWGSSSLGGALRIITNRPDVTKTEFRGRLTAASVTEGDIDYGLDAVANFPLVEDTLALRLTAYTRTDAGYLNAVNLGKKNSNKTTVSGGRASLRWLPTDRLTIDLTGTYQIIKADDGAAAWLNNPLDPTQVARTSDRVRYNYIPETREQSLTMANLVIEYDFGNVLLVSSTTFGEGELDSVTDQTTNESIQASPFTGGVIFEAGFFANDNTSTVTQEIRLLSDNPDSVLTWLIGGFYLDNDRDQTSFSQLLTNADLYPNTLLPGNATLTQSINNGRKEKAIFGEATWHISDQFDATIGARYFDNEQDFFVPFALVLPFPGFPPFMGGSPSTSSESDTNLKFSLAYRPNDDVMLYALASQGFRLGGTNGTAAVIAPEVAPAEYGSDSVWNYELGARTVFNEGRTVLNATIFYVDWSDLQSTFRLEAPLPAIPFFVNAGEAHTQGIEVEFSTKLSDNWLFRTAFTVLEAEIDDPGSIVGAIADISAGTKLPGSPEFQSYTSLEYSTTIAGRETTFSVSHLHVGESNYDLISTATQGDYDVFGLLVNLVLSDRVVATLFAQNLGDTDGVTSTVPAGNPFFGFPDLRYLIRPRTIGLSLQVEF